MKKEFLELGKTGKLILKELEGEADGKIERLFLVAIARTFEIAAEADQGMKDKGMIQTFENGARQVSPEWAIFRNAINDAKSLAKDLPKIREALHEAEQQPDARPTLEALMPKRKLG